MLCIWRNIVSSPGIMNCFARYKALRCFSSWLTSSQSSGHLVIRSYSNFLLPRQHGLFNTVTVTCQPNYIHCRFLKKSSSEFETPEADGGKFTEIFRLDNSELKRTRLFLVLARYQSIFFAAYLPLVVYSYASGAMPLNSFLPVSGFGLLLCGFMLSYFARTRYKVHSLAVDDEFAEMRLQYINLLGYPKRVFFPMKYTGSLEDPTISCGKHFASLTHRNHPERRFKLVYKGSFFPDEKLFLKTFGPHALAKFNEATAEK